MMIKKLICGLVALLATTGAMAAGNQANVTWVAPTQWTDGSTLVAADIASYTVSWSGGSITVLAPATSATLPVCGTVQIVVAVTSTAGSKYPSTTSGANSSVPYASGVQCSPNAVTGVKVS